MADSSPAADPRFRRWIHETICAVFYVSVTPVPNRPEVCFLPSLAELLQGIRLSLDELNGPLFIDAGQVEDVLLERMSFGFSGTTPFKYFVGCAFRVGEIRDDVRNQKFPDRLSLLTSILQLVTSYAGLVLISPEMCPQNQSVALKEPSKQILDELESGLISDEFLVNFVNRFSEDEDAGDTIRLFFAPIVAELRRRLEFTTDILSADLARPVALLTRLVHLRPIADRLPTWPGFLLPPHSASISGAHVSPGLLLESGTLLGPFFRPSAYPPGSRVREAYFAGTSARTQRDVLGGVRTVGQMLVNHGRSLHGIVKALLMSKPARPIMLTWLRNAVDYNMERSKSYSRMFSASSDGFLLNLDLVLLFLCDPFIGNNKIEMVDRRWLYKPSIRLAGAPAVSVTSIAASESEARDLCTTAIADENLGPDHEFNFITECFFLTFRGLHLGLIKSIANTENLERELSSVAQRTQVLESSRPEWIRLPNAAARDAELKSLKEKLDHLLSIRFACQSHYFAPDLLDRSFQFYVNAARWLLRSLNPNQSPLPLTIDLPNWYRVMPEHFVADIVEFWKTVYSAQNEYFTTNLPPAVRVLLEFLITFMSSSTLVNNIYLRAQMVELLGMIFATEKSDSQSSSPFGGGDLVAQSAATVQNPYFMHLEKDQTGRKYIISCLISIFCDLQKTGSHGQFYEKFRPRYYIGLLLRRLRVVPEYREILIQSADSHPDFKRFLNMLLDDATFMFDEAVKLLSSIREYEELAADPAKLVAVYDTEEKRTDAETKYAKDQSACRSDVLFGEEALTTIAFLTVDVPNSFMDPVLCDHLVTTVNNFLDNLAGTKSRNMKVKDMDRFNFRPRRLLSIVLGMYLNLRSFAAFNETLIGDERAKPLVILKRALFFVKRHLLLPVDKMEALEEYHSELVALKTRLEDEEIAMRDVPDEFLDPLVASIMRDPVMLPTSKNIVDRSTIERYLLSEPTDPYNRVPLSINDVIPVPELKARVNEFICQFREQKYGSGAPQSAVDVNMDESMDEDTN